MMPPKQRAKVARSVTSTSAPQSTATSHAVEIDPRIVGTLEAVDEQVHAKLVALFGAAKTVEGVDVEARIRMRQASEKINEVVARIKKHRCEPPLHNVSWHRSRHGDGLEVAGRTWSRPEARSGVLYHVHNPGGTFGSRASAASHIIAGFCLENVVVRNTSCPQRDDYWAVVSEKVFDWMRHVFQDRGYRIVVFAHFPWLHHAERLALEETLTKVSELLATRMADFPATVVLSTMSHVSASPTSYVVGTHDRSSAWPHAGMFRIFRAHCNDSVNINESMSFLVGGGHPGTTKNIDGDPRLLPSTNDVLNAQEQEFARRCSLRFWSIQELLEGRTPV